MTNYSSGHEAEKRAAEYLKEQGFEILELNWSNRLSEIDIVAKKDRTIYFVEVKYRENDAQGKGLDYITPGKLKQMEYAATSWILENNHDGDYELSAIELTGDYKVTEFIPQLT